MTPIYFLTAAKVVFSGFLVYRIHRFLRVHRSWELEFLLIFFSLLIISLAGTGKEWPELQKWLPITLAGFLLLITFEPEFLDFGVLISERLNANSINRKNRIINEIAESARALAATKTGALIAFERGDSLLKFGDAGVEINADIKKELIGTLFTKDTPTHDGGVLIRKGKATHCGAVFPLTERRQIENGLGTRHRAALGLTEKTDAVCLVVSEEEGTISLAQKGDLIYAIEPRELEQKLRKTLSSATRPHYYPIHYIKQLGPKLAQNNFLKLSKSFNQKLYDLLTVVFWACVLLLLFQLHILSRETFEEIQYVFLHMPWQFIVPGLLALDLLTFLVTKTVTADGVTNQVIYEFKFLFVPFFRRKIKRENLSAVLVKQEGRGGKLLSLHLLNKKRKAIFLDRSTAGKSLFDSAKKIRDILKIDLIS